MNTKINAQVPAQGISILFKSDEAIGHRVECECTSESHSVASWIEIESDDDCDIILVRFYVETCNKYCENFWERIKSAAKILFTGVDSKHHEIVMNKQTAKNWISAVSNNIERLENHEKQKI